MVVINQRIDLLIFIMEGPDSSHIFSLFFVSFSFQSDIVKYLVFIIEYTRTLRPTPLTKKYVKITTTMPFVVRTERSFDTRQSAVDRTSCLGSFLL